MTAFGSLAVSASSVNPAYWVKPGAHLIYYANMTSSNPLFPPGSLSYKKGTCYIQLMFPYIKVSFSFVNVSNGWAYVRVNVTMRYYPKFASMSNLNDELHGYVVAQYRASCGSPPFPNYVKVMNWTSHLRTNVRMRAVFYKRVTIGGTYRISLRNDSVYTSNGEYLGHTILFGLYPLSKRTPLLVYRGRRVYPGKVVVLNTTEITYLREFKGPNIFINTPRVNLSGIFSRLVLIYNPSSDVTLGFLGVVPDLKAIGVAFLGAFDNSAARYSRMHKKKLARSWKAGKDWAFGVVLTSANFLENSSSSNLNTSPPTSNFRWIYIIAGGVTLAVVGTLYWRKR